MTKPWSERNIKRKKCNRCDDEFQPTSGGNKYCLLCATIVKRENHKHAMRNAREKNPEKHLHYKMKHDLSKYGLTIVSYSEMFESQGGKCYICGTSESCGRLKHRTLCVDHCHSSGKVRSLLCNRCNRVLGMVSEDVDIMKSMIKYIGIHHE